MQRAHSALFRASDRYLRDKAGLSSSQHAVLLALMKRDGLPISEIAEQLNLGKSSLTGLIDRMSASGLVHRKRSTQDARVLTVHLEKEGRQLVEATLAGTRKINNQLLEPFSPGERETIAQFLTHLAENADKIVCANATAKTKERVSS